MKMKPKFKVDDRVMINPFADGIPLHNNERNKPHNSTYYINPPEHYMELLNGEATILDVRLHNNPEASVLFFEYKLKFDNPRGKARWCVPENFIVKIDIDSKKYTNLVTYYSMKAQQKELNNIIQCLEKTVNRQIRYLRRIK